ncbi:DNA-binding NarL/FixJ family response regulator [Saccharopolyspora erythraea NRRL 2338]|uniref:Response regulator transcription factor n=1 Tax=Saccharopolyspora erythraea TaxID=1836 RepID=A0ABN1E7I7_SACER|nr:response regulator transcription factor [Saccharopolyspora erythraea]PFG98317.1 DNA-binding NarL/FixJ family response regulator [Saccharopolyspora erythraea NRRL 2338]
MTILQNHTADHFHSSTRTASKGHKEQDTAIATFRVAIHASDKLIREGLAIWVQQEPRMSESDIADADVVAVAEDTPLSTLDTLRDLRSNASGRVLLISEYEWKRYMATAVRYGVRAVLWRGRFSRKAFLETIRTIGNGGGVLPPALQGALVEEFERIREHVLAPRDLTMHGLTSREVDVLHGVADGLSLEEIAQKLAYSERTIKNILYQFMKRLGLRNRAHAVAYAIRLGII